MTAFLNRSIIAVQNVGGRLPRLSLALGYAPAWTP